MDNLFLQILLGFIIIFISAMTQGITSFGFSLVSLPLLGIFLPLKIVVPVLVIYSLVLNTMILYHIKDHIDIKKIAILVTAGLIGTPFGAYLLKVTDETVLKIFVGVLLTFTAIINYYGIKIKVKNEKLSFIPVGLVSGLLNGSVSLGGPPVVLFLTNQSVEKMKFRANLTSYFWILNIITVPTYFFGGLITKDVVTYTAYLFPGLIIGTLTGIKLGNKVDEELFRKLTLVLIMVMGILSIYSAMS
ncbi:sulfite exporter TauE/SafE family protein [Alkaliphilus hydrothermalis]|uniref:Probable membrane transporter protein n=1 Tax=Alkaliphilus hydrothermalis TaxID=1482730 RepID=A0ABS2NSY2_9FIRM|nr:sulfite exporter TauE/SafE family protein [Alkaliphilus hydrothermalis]MBM7615684.1 putative membrane protein YfcA [Alkaliphilus hydrothermalis]